MFNAGVLNDKYEIRTEPVVVVGYSEANEPCWKRLIYQCKDGSRGTIKFNSLNSNEFYAVGDVIELVAEIRKKDRKICEKSIGKTLSRATVDFKGW